MGEWKAQVSLRVRQQLRVDMEEFAKKERRTLGNVGELLLEWGFEQLRKAGSITALLGSETPVPRNHEGNYRRKTERKAVE